MCLFSKTNIPSIANENIACYKILVYSAGMHYTPFRAYPIVPIGIIEAEGDDRVIKDVLHSDKYRVRGGYIHTYKNITTIKFPLCMRIYKCIIPKGTPYFEGVSEVGNTEGYASKMIQFIEEVKLN